MPGRKYTNGNQYRYGFNGQENSEDIAPGLTTALYWEYDGRIGRRWNIDPVLKVEESPYLCFSGNPILNFDLLGDDAEDDGGKKKKKNTTQTASNKISKLPLTPSRAGLYKLDGNGPTFPIYPLPVKQKEQEILAADIFGNGHIGPKSVVESNISSIKQNYYNAVADNIAGGPFGAAGYFISGNKGSFVGSSIDGIAMSFGGIPGESTIFPNSARFKTKSSFNTNEVTALDQTPINLYINLKPNWNKEQVSSAYNKAQAISNNYETKVTLKTGVTRQSNTRSQFIKQGGTILKNQHVDHIIELQINGTNSFNNLQGLDGSVNTSFGSQIYQQIKAVPENTRVNKVLINPFR